MFVHQVALIFSLLVPKEAFFGYVAVCGFGTTLQNTALIINKSPVVIVMNYQIIISDSYPVWTGFHNLVSLNMLQKYICSHE